MIAELKDISSPDFIVGNELVDGMTFIPEVPDNFYLFLELLIGPRGVEGEELFYTNVCTPKWIQFSLQNSNVLLMNKTIIMNRYDYSAMYEFIKYRVSKVNGKDWNSIAKKINETIGDWEFHGYQPYSP